MENEPKLSKIFIKKYEKIKILGEGNYGKTILVKSLTDNVNK
jgi:GTPase SAR1 family protein